MESTADLKQVGGDHYKTSAPDLQHWNVILKLGFGCEYYIGQATKYLSRWKKKNGLRDIAKGRHFIEKALEIVERDGEKFLTYGGYVDLVTQDIAKESYDRYLKAFFEANEVDDASATICTVILFANGAQALRDAIVACEALERAELAREQQAATPVADKEPPVSLAFKFMGYEEDRINWLCNSCGTPLRLKLNEPPNYAHQCPGIEVR